MKNTTFILALLASSALADDAAAATLPAIQIEECQPAYVASGPRLVHGEPENWNTHIERVDVCRWPVLPENPFAYDLLADLKGTETPVLPDTPPGILEATFTPTPRGSGTGRVGGASASSWSSASHLSVFHVHTKDCGCECKACEMPIDPEPETPAPVPLSDALGFLIGCLSILVLVGLYRNIDDFEEIR